MFPLGDILHLYRENAVQLVSEHVQDSAAYMEALTGAGRFGCSMFQLAALGSFRSSLLVLSGSIAALCSLRVISSLYRKNAVQLVSEHMQHIAAYPDIEKPQFPEKFRHDGLMLAASC